MTGLSEANTQGLVRKQGDKSIKLKHAPKASVHTSTLGCLSRRVINHVS